MNLWQEKIKLRFGNVDCSDRLTLCAAFAFFQEAAISHAAVLGVGRDAMMQNKQAWLLSRLSVFMEQRPGYEEDIIIRSWPRGPEKLFALRDYDISLADKALVRGRSGWLVIDLEKRRPLRVEAVTEKLPLNHGLDALLSGPAGLVSRDKLALYGERQAAYSDIDYYGHVNNVRYVQWIQDMTAPDLLYNASQMRLDINYLGEIQANENIELYSCSIENSPLSVDYKEDYPASPSYAFAYEGRRKGESAQAAQANKGQVVFRAELRLGN